MVKPSSVSSCFQCVRAFRQLIFLLATQKVLCLSQLSLLLRGLWWVSVASSAVSASDSALPINKAVSRPCLLTCCSLPEDAVPLKGLVDHEPVALLESAGPLEWGAVGGVRGMVGGNLDPWAVLEGTIRILATPFLSTF